MVLDTRPKFCVDKLLVRIPKGPHGDDNLGLTLVDIPWYGIPLVVIKDVSPSKEGLSLSEQVWPGDALLAVNGENVTDARCALSLLEEADGIVELWVVPLNRVWSQGW